MGILSFGGSQLNTINVETRLIAGTNNQANHAYVASNPEDEDPPYAAIACDVAIQTAKPKTVEEVMNLHPGDYEGNRKSSA